MGSVGEAKRPNFLVIVADDLGYSDIGPFGSEIPTPALDFLANTGVRLTNFHTASACSPTRSMLLSGTDHHIAGLGQMAEHMPPNARDTPGYEGYLNFRVAALPEVLQDSGYETMMAGKWHLGTTKETSPSARGFEKSFVFLSGCHNHFNYEPHLEDPNHSVLNINAAKMWMHDSAFIDRTKDIPADFYSTTSYSQAIINQLKTRDTSKPFFAYLAFTAPHWPLQAPQSVIAKYKGHYNDGPEALRTKRVTQLARLGLISPDVAVAPMCHGPTEWSEMTEAERVESARKMEVFAAMVDLIDQNIGKVLDHLDATGELDNTFILFMSDNGAEGALLEAMPIMGGASKISSIIDKYFDNSLDNIGNADSYVWYGPAWATASMAPSRGFKTWITEGGIRCPCIVRYPPAFGNSTNNQAYQTAIVNGGAHPPQTGVHTDSFATVMDIFPTILALADVPIPDPVKPFRGRNIVPIRGTSWLPHLANKTAQFHPSPEEITGWELFNSRAIRQGPYKALWMAAPRGKDRWELYDVEKDPGEGVDLAEDEAHRGVLERLVACWERYVSETGLVDDPVWGAEVDAEVGIVWGGR
ncbi:hypothetical protein B0A52_01353 [Exophiala mesophila]|uniref:Sulfatase N-terminal domain-containing protein n=1 Tax=Exophiala mesophila TaxID=212818 RepID=A0A438NH87_EXOME|nr:hypothetical protein B0A52_01353 [Exophiala mesophila]